MIDETVRRDAEAHTTLHTMLRIIQAITTSSVEDELEILQEQCPLFQEFADNFGFVFGYSEVLQSVLLSLMAPLIERPRAFGYETDEGLQRWWFYLRDGGTQALPVLTEESDHDMATMLATISGLMVGCRKSGNSWSKLTDVMRDTQAFGQSVLASLPKCHAVSNQMDGETFASTSGIIKQRAADWLSGPLLEGSAIDFAVKFINPGGTKFYPDEYWGEELIQDVLTPMDEDYGLHIPMPRPVHSSHSLGTLIAVAVATANLLGSRISDMFPCLANGNIKTLAQCVDANLDRLLKSHKNAATYVLAPDEIARIPTPSIVTHLESVYSQHNRLKAILGSNRRLVASADEISPRLIKPVLDGLCLRLAPNERINVLWIRSMRDDTPYTKVTIALEMPLTSMISDHSTWWCFYGVAGTATSDPDVIKSEVAIENLLDKYEQCIKITDIGPLADDQLIELLTPHGWNKLRAAHKHSVDANADLRSALSETLAALYIGAQGYGTVRNSVKLKDNGREIDAVGGHCSGGENQILVAEVKGRSTHDQELRDSYERFCALVDMLQEEPNRITARLGLSEGPTMVKGIYISLGNAEEFGIPQYKAVELWGFDKFCEELKNARIPGRYRQLLKKEYIAEFIEMYDDEWMTHHSDNDSRDVFGEIIAQAMKQADENLEGK